MPDKFVIGLPYTQGIQRDKPPFMIMDNAFEALLNAYVWRGQLRKRIGSRAMTSAVSLDQRQKFSRLRILINTTDVNGDANGTVPGVVIDRIGQMFSCGDEYYTVTATGAPATVISTGGGVFTYDTSGGGAGMYTLVGGPAETDLFFYPSFPVMHIGSYEQAAINSEITVAFDTQFVYDFTTVTGWRILGPIPPAANSGLWSGTDSDFHSSTNFRGNESYDYLLFVVNNVVNDEIQYYDGNNWNKTTFEYDSVNNRDILTAKEVIQFKGRLLLFNTTEETAAGNQVFRNRMRYSQVGSPLQADAWHEGPAVTGKGGFIEVPTREAIIGAQTIRDRMIVFCERSTWELVFTNNRVLPFVFQELNSTLGVESLNSLISFDRQILGFGSNGIHSCNGVNVQRIDEEIPNEIFDINNDNNGPERVASIRDYDSEVVMWSYNDKDFSDTVSFKYPNLILLYNYRNNSWANFNDSITAFGYFQIAEDVTWNQLDIEWQECELTWSDPSLKSKYRTVIAGNQQGFTFLMNKNIQSNAQSLSITNITVSEQVVTVTIFDHNLKVNDYIFINNVISDDNLEGLNQTIYKVNSIVDANVLTVIDTNNLTGTYEGAGTIRRIDPPSILTKAFNFYQNQSSNMFINQINFFVDKESNTQLLVKWKLNTSNVDIQGQATDSDTQLGESQIDCTPNALVPLEETQSQLWRDLYPNIEGENIQMLLNMAENDILDPAKAFDGFTIYGMIFWTEPTFKL